MPRYRFEFREGLDVETVNDVELTDHAAAHQEAVAAARESMIDGVLDGVDQSEWCVRIHDESGHLVETLAFADLLRKRPCDETPPQPQHLAVRPK
jgi:hypothetical protein